MERIIGAYQSNRAMCIIQGAFIFYLMFKSRLECYRQIGYQQTESFRRSEFRATFDKLNQNVARRALQKLDFLSKGKQFYFLNQISINKRKIELFLSRQFLLHSK